MKKILIANAYYYPGFRSGGPQQTIMNLVSVLGNEYDFYILTHNHDFGRKETYEGIEYNKWVPVGNAKVFYSSKKKYNLKFLEDFVKPFDIVYLCEPYQEHTYKILLLNKLNRIKAKVVVASMGCFSKGALSKKQLKKVVYWKLFKSLKLYKDINWSFSSELEKIDAINTIGIDSISKFFIAEDLPRKYIDLSKKKNTMKLKGKIKIVFLSRICEMKNLLSTIQIITKLNGDVIFDIYGTIEDEKYWNICKNELSKLPKNIKWKYLGEVEASKVLDILINYDIFCLQSFGENFGHVIYESLVAGCVPFISNHTPWKDLEKYNCGHIFSLDDNNKCANLLQKYIEMNNAEIWEYQINAMRFAKMKYNESVLNSGYLNIFR